MQFSRQSSEQKFFKWFSLLLVIVLMVMSYTLSSTASAAQFDKEAQTLASQAKGINVQVVETALTARDRALQQNIKVANPDVLTIIDYDKPSSKNRMYVFDLKNNTLLHKLKTTQGEGSGISDNAQSFSNQPGSHQTSLGLFLTAETYQGRNGYSLRLDGLEAGINDNARSRAIVIHGAKYARAEVIPQLGRLGVSYGCPAVDDRESAALIDTIKSGSLVYAYHSGQWLQGSRFLA